MNRGVPAWLGTSRKSADEPDEPDTPLTYNAKIYRPNGFPPDQPRNEFCRHHSSNNGMSAPRHPKKQKKCALRHPQKLLTIPPAQAHRIMAQIMLVGSRVIGRAFVEAYRQAQASAKYAKAAQTSGGPTINVRGGLTLDEAYKILSVKPDAATGLSMETVAERYRILFERNDPKKGGSFYLQSKVYRARERLEQEAKRTGQKKAEPTAQP